MSEKLPVTFLKDIRLADVLSNPELKKRLKDLEEWENESAKTHWVLGEPLEVTRKRDLERMVERMIGDMEDIRKLFENKSGE